MNATNHNSMHPQGLSSTFSTGELEPQQFPELDRDVITAWMRNHDWSVKSSGPGGEMWASHTVEGAEIGVPFGHLDNFFSEAVIKRLAHWHKLEQRNLVDVLTHFTIDVSRFIADVPLDYSSGKPGAELRVVSHLFGGTGRIYRAAAHTSRSTTPVIGSSFSDLDDERYANAIAGMTEVGSYSLPIYVPVGKPDTDGSYGLAAPSESRRLTQTVATALRAIEQHVIEPHRFDVSEEVVREMVSQGVSKELLTAVSELIGVEGTDAKTRFAWAESHSKVPGADKLPTAVEIPHEARGLVDQVATLFRPTPKQPTNFVGKVRGLLLGESPDEIISVVAVPRQGSTEDPSAPLVGTIEVTHHEASEEFRDKLYQFMSEETFVQFSGTVKRISNRRHISDPRGFQQMPTQAEL